MSLASWCYVGMKSYQKRSMMNRNTSISWSYQVSLHEVLVCLKCSFIFINNGNLKKYIFCCSQDMLISPTKQKEQCSFMHSLNVGLNNGIAVPCHDDAVTFSVITLNYNPKLCWLLFRLVLYFTMENAQRNSK